MKNMTPSQLRQSTTFHPFFLKLPNHMNRRADLQVLPGLLGGIHQLLQHNRQREAGATAMLLGFGGSGERCSRLRFVVMQSP